MSLTSKKLIAKAETFKGIKAGIARRKDILNAPSYKKILKKDKWGFKLLDKEAKKTEWQDNAKSLIILGLNHPENKPELDWWNGKNTDGNRKLMETSDNLIEWLKNNYQLDASSLPYYAEYGGVFLKDTAVYAGLGIIGKNNLLINPEWGPRIRLRAILLNAEFQPNKPLQNFSPCDACNIKCQSACPKNCFAQGFYNRDNCITQLNTDKAKSMQNSKNPFIKFCRSCEFACPVGK